MFKRYASATVAAVISSSAASATSYQDIYDFKGSFSDGDLPNNGVTVDSAGRLVGATLGGGAAFLGTIYRLSPPLQAGAQWSEQVLVDFGLADNQPADPIGPVVLNGDSTVIGTTTYGGTDNAGIVYRLDESGPQWNLTILHMFAGQADGGDPNAGVATGPSGLLYGSALEGGSLQAGTIYSISPDFDEPAFRSKPLSVGVSSASRPLAIGTKSLVYTVKVGGSNGLGAVMAAQQTLSGHWNISTLYSFGAPGDASSPFAATQLVAGPHRVIYGCAAGGSFGTGAVYQLTPPVAMGSAWTENVLYSFGLHLDDPNSAYGNCYISRGSHNDIVGVTTNGGSYGTGAFFKLEPPLQAGGSWTETVLYSFNYRGMGLYMPTGAPARIGNTYFGTAEFGGVQNPTFGGSSGGVWSLTP